MVSLLLLAAQVSFHVEQAALQQRAVPPFAPGLPPRDAHLLHCELKTRAHAGEVCAGSRLDAGREGRGGGVG